MKTYPVKVECVDEVGELLFTLETFDEGCATLEIKQPCFNRYAFDVMVKEVHKAFDYLQLEGDEIDHKL